MSGAERRGARALHLPDWPYGAVGRRLVLEALLLDPQPESGWTKAALERRTHSKPGAIDNFLAGMLDWGIAVPDENGKWRRSEQAPEIASPLEGLLQLTRKAEDRPIVVLPKRAYKRRS